jgi:glycosyltransferase involved in cell wall biosynthesis
MKILFLYAEIMGYTLATLNALAKQGATLHVVHWDHQKLTPYRFPPSSSMAIYNRSEMSVAAMAQLAEEVDPDITVVSGWMDKGYLSITKKLRAKGKKVVCGFDDQWHGGWRQQLAGIAGKFGFLSRYFSHAWVTGCYQYEYARRLGFKKTHIVQELYAADIPMFQKAYGESVERKRRNYPHRFLFVGRFEAVKGLDVLLSAWQKMTANRKDWELHLIGNGSLKSILGEAPGVIVKDFMQPEELIKEVAEAGCFVLPSNFEPWGVVVQEFAAAGLPLILSDAVGAAPTFLISGYNGYHFKVGDKDALMARMLQIIQSSDEELRSMANVSHLLSGRILPETSAANLLSLAK